MTPYDIFHDSETDGQFSLVATGVDGNSAEHAYRQWAKSLAEAGVSPEGAFLLVPTRNTTYLDAAERQTPQLVITELASPAPRPLRLVEEPAEEPA